jgi:hypothetical protein
MPKAPMNRNPAKVRPGANMTRPNGASAAANSIDPEQLLRAAMHGNRATRRLARRNLKKQLKSESVIR